MKRTIVQFTVMPFTFLGIVTGYRQHALCDDGSFWYRDATDTKDSTWKLVDDLIPDRPEK